MNTRIKIATWGAVLATAALLTSCGSDAAPTTSATTAAPNAARTAPHNKADIAFATEMIPHHAQAVEMSKYAADNAASPKVKDLAKRIESAQQPEIDQMSGWLKAWGAPVPDPDDSSMGGMHHGSGSGMPGMMSSDQMKQLGDTKGASFDKMFLEMMIQHHEGAITMSNTELSNGQSTEAKALAQRIITEQRAEIAEMRSLLAAG